MISDGFGVIDDCLDKQEIGIALSEIKRRCEEFVKKRDSDPRNNYVRDWYSGQRERYFMREGKKIERDRLRAMLTRLQPLSN